MSSSPLYFLGPYSISFPSFLTPRIFLQSWLFLFQLRWVCVAEISLQNFQFVTREKCVSLCVFLAAEKPNMFAEYSFFLSIISCIALHSSSQYWKDTGNCVGAYLWNVNFNFHRKLLISSSSLVIQVSWLNWYDLLKLYKFFISGFNYFKHSRSYSVCYRNQAHKFLSIKRNQAHKFLSIKRNQAHKFPSYFLTSQIEDRLNPK